MSLSLGKVRNGCLVCPYHGWTFDSAGFATSSGTPKMTLRADAMETMERDGVVWIKNPSTTSQLPRLSTAGFYPLFLAWADFNAPLELLYDNFTDIEHTGDTTLKVCRLSRFDKPVVQSRCQLEALHDTQCQLTATNDDE